MNPTDSHTPKYIRLFCFTLNDCLDMVKKLSFLNIIFFLDL